MEFPSTMEHEGFVGSWGNHPPRLNTQTAPIVNEYREGKVKSTPEGE